MQQLANLIYLTIKNNILEISKMAIYCHSLKLTCRRHVRYPLIAPKREEKVIYKYVDISKLTKFKISSCSIEGAI